jgi:phosphopantothenoylcysteine synthetase/decarboxylase
MCHSLQVRLVITKATQRNLQTLVEDGVHVIMPDAGEQACGDVGLGPKQEILLPKKLY